jgi:hypothetical protein
MSNPVYPIKVISAMYGIPTRVADVTTNVQVLFDQQAANNASTQTYNLQSIQPSLFGIPDPASGQPKAFTIVYNLPAVGTDVFMRGALDFQTLTLTAGPARTIQVKQAVYTTNIMGLDVTGKLNAYLRDPGNSIALEIDGATFRAYLTDGCDIQPAVDKYFSASYTVSPNQDIRYVCGHEGQTVNFV